MLMDKIQIKNNAYQREGPIVTSFAIRKTEFESNQRTNQIDGEHFHSFGPTQKGVGLTSSLVIIEDQEIQAPFSTIFSENEVSKVSKEGSGINSKKRTSVNNTIETILEDYKKTNTNNRDYS